MSSHDGTVTMRWADGEYTFRLALGQLRELQEKTDCGPPELCARIAAKRWRVDDLRETLRLGLIGGGMAPVAALRLVERYVDERPLLESVAPATMILLGALVGPTDDAVGKPDAAEDASDRPTD